MNEELNKEMPLFEVLQWCADWSEPVSKSTKRSCAEKLCIVLLFSGGPGQFININFDYFLTECDYDFLYIYGGNSYSSRLIGSFSGATKPDTLSISAADANTPVYVSMTRRMRSVESLRL